MSPLNLISRRYTLITGGAGFIGTNVARRLLEDGHTVLIFDNLSRPGVERNLKSLQNRFGDRLMVQVDSIRNPIAIREAVSRADRVYHFAAQVAVTTSVVDPVDDFDTNLRGSLNLLEALRALPEPPPLLFTSTNKVYGNLDVLPLRADGSRYRPVDPTAHGLGIGENQPLDFHSPYGCSKGAADQYVHDYSRIYGLKTVVFRMSCIYGPHQFGTEDQGWVAHFILRALNDEAITIYGDGRQVRDVLYIDDLVDAMIVALDRIDRTSGQVFNMGGGPARTLSLIELLDLITYLKGSRPEVIFDAWRPGDQRYYVSDTRAFRKTTGWSPHTRVEDGVHQLFDWLQSTSRVTPINTLAV